MTAPDPNAQAADPAALPFGLTGEEPVFERAMEIARALFGEVRVALVMVRDGRIVRSIGRDAGKHQHDPASERVISTGQAIWIEDLSQDPVTAPHPLVGGERAFRFFAGAPVRLPDGRVLGSLSVVESGRVRPRDERLLQNLQRLADMLADEFERARAQEALAQGERRLQTTQSALASLVELAPIQIIMVDREMRLLHYSQTWLGESGFAGQDLRGRNVYDIRKAMGKELAREAPAAADVVVPIPDSGVPAAIGFSQESGLPFELGIIRNHYVGRTFIQPTQSVRPT